MVYPLCLPGHIFNAIPICLLFSSTEPNLFVLRPMYAMCTMYLCAECQCHFTFSLRCPARGACKSLLGNGNCISRSVSAKTKSTRTTGNQTDKPRRQKPKSDVSFRFTQEPFTERDTNTDEHSISVHSRSQTRFSDFTPTMDSFGTWDSTCSRWRLRCCSGRASHPMQGKSGYSAGKKANIVGLDVILHKHIPSNVNCESLTGRRIPRRRRGCRTISELSSGGKSHYLQ